VTPAGGEHGADRSAAAGGEPSSARERWAAVDEYLSDRLAPGAAALTEALAANAAAGLPAADVSPAQGRLLELLARLCGARAILEIGTLGGYSTIWLAGALPPDGRLVTLESDPHHAHVARANLARAGLSGVVEVVEGPALETLPGVPGAFDLVFIDADKQRSVDYLALALERSRPGTLIVADNVVRGGTVVDPESEDPRVVGVRRLVDAVAANPRLVAAGLQTVGVKGWDGMVLALVV
jgi:predicted O-methyltransferase YrrM